MTSRMFLVAAALAGSLLLACSSDDGKPSDGTTGTATGTATGTGAPTGAASGTPTGTATSTTASPPAEAGAKAGPIGACAKDDDCTTGVCYLGDQGSYCSLTCTADNAATVCIAPFAGTCNKKGFCKKP